MNIDGSSAIVFGGASGLGEAAATRLAQAGAKITIADLDAARGGALAARLGGDFLPADVRDEAQVTAAVEVAARRPGGLRVALCCAGTGSASKIAGSRGPHSLEDFERVIAINLIGTFNALRLAAAARLDNGPNEEGERGVLIATASIAAFDGQVGQLAYSASKAGIVGMTLPVARDLAPAGVRMMTIAPGLFDTPLLATLPQEARDSLGADVPFPPRLGRPAEFALLVEQIAANPMLNGETVRLDGAIRMAPR
jgi:NAD(P)-dependent dehydrogenase (short-subunit alcohol dehydrogenase family)